MTAYVPHTVLVLGAGFTKAFFRQAPLLVDDWGIDLLLTEFARFPAAANILRSEVQRSREEGHPKGQIHLERLMTRLDGGMPFDDAAPGARAELQRLLADLISQVLGRLERSRSLGCDSKEEFAALASHCVKSHTPIVTFNYDDFLDEALYKVNPPPLAHMPSGEFWSPNGGYGFYCRPSVLAVTDQLETLLSPPMLLIKLHGSTNWRIRKGYPRPYTLDAVMHHEVWTDPLEPTRSYASGSMFDMEDIEFHLESDPFIVPPVLMKSALTEQPVLRHVWSRAFELLREARRVIFVGYSLPVTDIAAGFLFREALGADQRRVRGGAGPRVEVVGYAETDGPDAGAAKGQLRSSYRQVFPHLEDDQFDFSGAVEWSRKFVAEG